MTTVDESDRTIVDSRGEIVSRAIGEMYLFNENGRQLSKRRVYDVHMTPVGNVIIGKPRLCVLNKRHPNEFNDECFTYTIDCGERQEFCTKIEIRMGEIEKNGTGYVVTSDQGEKYVLSIQGGIAGKFTVFKVEGNLYYMDNIEGLHYSDEPISAAITDDGMKAMFLFTYPDEKYGIIKIYDRYKLKFLDIEIDGFISDVAVTKDGNRTMVAVYDTIHPRYNNVYMYHDNELEWKYPIEEGASCAAMTPDGDRIVAGSYNNTVYLLDSGGNMLWNYTTEWDIADVDITDDGRYIVAGSKDMHLYVLDEEGSLLWKFKTDYKIDKVGISPEGKTIAASTEEIVEEKRIRQPGATIVETESKGYTLYAFRGPA